MTGSLKRIATCLRPAGTSTFPGEGTKTIGRGAVLSGAETKVQEMAPVVNELVAVGAKTPASSDTRYVVDDRPMAVAGMAKRAVPQERETEVATGRVADVTHIPDDARFHSMVREPLFTTAGVVLPTKKIARVVAARGTPVAPLAGSVPERRSGVSLFRWVDTFQVVHLEKAMEKDPERAWALAAEGRIGALARRGGEGIVPRVERNELEKREMPERTPRGDAEVRPRARDELSSAIKTPEDPRANTSAAEEPLGTPMCMNDRETCAFPARLPETTVISDPPYPRGVQEEAFAPAT